MNLTFPFAVNVMLKLSNKRKGSGEGRGTAEVSPAASPQMLSSLSCNKTARCKLASENWREGARVSFRAMKKAIDVVHFY